MTARATLAVVQGFIMGFILHPAFEQTPEHGKGTFAAAQTINPDTIL